MRNKFSGVCYRCKKWVPKGEGHFERSKIKKGLLLVSGWRVIHAECVFEQRKEKYARSKNET